MTNADGNTTDYGYNADNLEISVTDPMSNESQAQYDADGNVMETIDAAGNTTHYYYSLVDEPVLTVDPLGNSQFTVFDVGGNSIATINQIGGGDAHP